MLGASIGLLLLLSARGVIGSAPELVKLAAPKPLEKPGSDVPGAAWPDMWRGPEGGSTGARGGSEPGGTWWPPFGRLRAAGELPAGIDRTCRPPRALAGKLHAGSPVLSGAGIGSGELEAAIPGTTDCWNRLMLPAPPPKLPAPGLPAAGEKAPCVMELPKDAAALPTPREVCTGGIARGAVPPAAVAALQSVLPLPAVLIGCAAGVAGVSKPSRPLPAANGAFTSCLGAAPAREPMTDVSSHGWRLAKAVWGAALTAAEPQPGARGTSPAARWVSTVGIASPDTIA